MNFTPALHHAHTSVTACAVAAVAATCLGVGITSASADNRTGVSSATKEWKASNAQAKAARNADDVVSATKEWKSSPRSTRATKEW